VWDGALSYFDANELFHYFTTPFFTNTVRSSQPRFVVRVDGDFYSVELLVLSRFVF
jgi:hypothetical protein